MCYDDGMKNALTETELLRLTLDEMNSGLSCYREDLRYTREDAVNFVTLWNKHKLSTVASISNDDGYPYIIVTNA